MLSVVQEMYEPIDPMTMSDEEVEEGEDDPEDYVDVVPPPLEDQEEYVDVPPPTVVSVEALCVCVCGWQDLTLSQTLQHSFAQIPIKHCG